METVGMQKAEEELKVDSLTILGWHSSGSRKVSSIRPIFNTRFTNDGLFF